MDKDTAIWTAFCLLVGVGVTLTGLVNITIGYLCLVFAAILFIYQVIGLWKRILSKQYPWLVPLIIGVVLLISPFIVHKVTNKPPPIVKAELHAVLKPLSMQAIGTVDEPTKISWIILTLTFIVGCSILLLYYRAKKGIWPFRNKGIIQKRLIVQELYDKLTKIGENKWPGLDWQSVGDARTKINEWKITARRLIFQSLGQQELNNILERINYVEDRNEYLNPAIGGIQAFYNEKQIYLQYLKDLLESLEKNPELWS